MRRLRITWLLVGFVGLATTSAQAGLMPVSATMTPESGTNLYSYSVSLTAGSTLKTGDYFTIYDVSGYVAGSVNAPAGWAMSSTNTGLTPAFLAPTDNASVPNLTFTYTGASSVVAGVSNVSIGTVTFDASSTPIPTIFASQTHTGNTMEGSVFGISPSSTSPSGPTGTTGSNTPEPATLLLLGMALPFVGVRRWMSRKE